MYRVRHSLADLRAPSKVWTAEMHDRAQSLISSGMSKRKTAEKLGLTPGIR
jgi:hypothetical protein